MLGKVEILIVIIVLLLTFYFVIWLGAGGYRNSSHKINKYLFGVRILIIVIAIVSLILWLLL